MVVLKHKSLNHSVLEEAWLSLSIIFDGDTGARKLFLHTVYSFRNTYG